MKFRLALIIIIYSLTLFIYAAPSKNVYYVYKQIDGSDLTLCKIGDEFFHYYVTTDGLPLIKAENGGFYYAIVTDDSISISSLLAHDRIYRDYDEEAFVNFNNKETSKQISKIWQQHKMNNQAQVSCIWKSNKLFESVSPYIGKKRGLVILVDFANFCMSGDSVNSNFDRMFNELGYSEDNHIGSVHDYFYDQSYGQFDLTFDVVGPLTLSHNYGYYGQNIDEFRGDKRAGTMIIEACKAVDEIVDFKNYDWDDDGVVETVYVVYAGYGENASDDSSTIWPHKSSLSGRAIVGDGDGELKLDDVTIDVYACSSELAGASGIHLNGIGTACHEFSHCLGLPDLYDTNYSGAFGMNKWDVMDSGSYSGPNERGEVPYGYSAFERAYVGWMEIEPLEGNNEYIVYPLNNHSNAYMLMNECNDNEFFIIENHQSDKWFSYVGKYTDMHGMMITHIDYDIQAWKNNAVNSSPKHMRESIVPADYSYGTFNSTYNYYNPSESDYRGDLFPGMSNNNRFSSRAYENCGGKLFNRNVDRTYNLNLNIDNIIEECGVITFTVGSPIERPKDIMVHQIGDKLEIHWGEVTEAEEYCLELNKIKSILPSRVEKETIDGLRDSKYVIEDVNCKQCIVKVRAKNKYVSSEWSDQVNVTINLNTVTTIFNEESVKEYYTINGIKCETVPKKGLYIVKYKDEFKKILLP